MNSIVNIFVLLGFAACCALTSLAQPLEAQSLAPAGDTKLRQTHSPTAVSPKLFSNSKKSKLYLSNFSIKKIRFTGNNLLSNKRLEKLTEPYLNKPIDATQLDYLRSNIRSVYRDMGGFARIVFERRGIDDSELSINIEELVFKSSQFSGNSFLSNEQVEALIEPYLNSAFDFKNIKILNRTR